MHLIQPAPHQAHAGLRAMKMLASSEGAMDPAARALMEAAQRQLLRTSFDIDTLPPITPEELAAVFDDRALSEQLVRAMTLICVADDVPSTHKTDLMTSFAQALRIDVPEVKVIFELAHRQMLLFRFDFYRRSHIRGVIEEQFKQAGWLESLRQLAAFRGLTEEPGLGARYRALGELPADTLGYAFFRHCVDNGFSFPGERYGFPEGGVYHDFAHVLGGYGATPEGEMLVAAFIAGFRKDNPSFIMLFVMLTFGAGLNMTPVEQAHVQHVLATPGLADRFFQAIERGARVTQDLSVGWNHWDYVALPMDEARRRLGVSPV